MLNLSPRLTSKLSMALIKNEVPEDISTKLDKEYEQEVARINKILDSETK